MRKILTIFLLGLVVFANEELMLDCANSYIMCKRANKEAPFSTLVSQSKAIVVLPSVKKVGFLLGGMGGSGVMIINPLSKDKRLVGVDIKAGSLGLQVGYKDSALVMFILRDSIVADIQDGKFTFGVEASFSFGDINRGFNKVKSFDFSKDVYVYATNGGFFAGASFAGVVLSSNETKFKNDGYAYSQLIQAISR